jgi:integrase
MVTKLNEEVVKALPVPEKGNRVSYFAGARLQGVTAPAGFGVRVTAAGARSYVLNYRADGVERRLTIGKCKNWPAVKAVRYARELRQGIDRGEDPMAARVPKTEDKTVGAVLDDFIVGYAKKKLRRWLDVESAFRRLVVPAVGRLSIHKLDRGHVARMLDKIEADSGPVMADRTRAYLSKALSWYSERDGEFTLGKAIVRVQPRAAGRARSRVLSDEEIRAVWAAAGEAGTFGTLIKFLLLTGQRRNEAALMTWAEVGQDGTWEIPASRYKTKRPHAVQLSAAALALIARKESDFVFPSTGRGAYLTHSRGKLALDKALGDAVQPWVLHDLRRTAKTLMARAGVRPDISERVLGHVIAGVEGVYDRHSYADEKRDALEKLASMVERIVNPPPANVLPLRREG